MNINEFEKLVLDSIAKVRAEGIKVRAETYGNFYLYNQAITWNPEAVDALGDHRQCCALGAVALTMPAEEFCEAMRMSRMVRFKGQSSDVESSHVIEAVGAYYNLSDDARTAFIAGFDNDQLAGSGFLAYMRPLWKGWFDLGMKIRETIKG